MSLRHEELLGPFDGSAVAFSTQTDYVPTTVRAFVGLLQKQVDVVELGGKDVVLSEAPLDGDVLIFVYRTIVS